MPLPTLAFPHRVVGIIAEYNPFHCGHAFHLQEARRISGASFCVVAMSGDFVQRGAPAIFDKYTRARMALLAGADLVVELPPMFATASAEDFAACGVALLDRLGVVGSLCFGSEWGSLPLLWELARILAEEPEEVATRIKGHTAAGLSYPRARQLAVSSFLSHSPQTQSAAETILSSPNNILGIEYCKALIRRGSAMEPLTIPRAGKGYHDGTLSDTCHAYSSATALRRVLLQERRFHRAEGAPCFPSPVLSPVPSPVPPPSCTELLAGQIPPSCLATAEEAFPLSPGDFSSLLSCRLLDLSRQGVPLDRFVDVSPELAARIGKQSLDFSPFEEKAAALKTRQYTYSRVSRSLIHILLHMTDDAFRRRKESDYVSYARVLGFRREAAPLLSAIKRASSLPLITGAARARRILQGESLEWFREDLVSSHLYRCVLEEKSGRTMKNEYTQPPIVL